MVEVTVLYGPPADPSAFEEHYSSRHRPLVAKMPSVQRFEASRVVGTPDGGEPPYYRIAELCSTAHRTSRRRWAPTKAMPPCGHPNFATGGATVVISEID